MATMQLPLYADPPPLSQTDDGVVRISGTRIPLERVIRSFLAGATPEQIAQDYDVLAIEDVYAVVNYFLHHRDEVLTYLSAAEQEARKIQDELEQVWDPAGIRARLRARSSARAN
jgi:uncharacterized protein (DUF433 family)